jgi:uncharacterized protein YndB with AHSA1/START domain
MADSLELHVDVKATPAEVYRTWTSSKGHSKMTGASATFVASPGGKHTAWDGYIWGQTTEIEPAHRVRQTWRTTDFPATAPDSVVEIRFQPIEGGTRVTIAHAEIPPGQGKRYDTGWKQFYFKPMIAWFGKPAPVKKAAPAKKAAPKKKAAAQKAAAPKKKAAAKRKS